MTDKITSTANPKIKQLVVLQQKSAERRRQNLIVIEGWREVRMALEARFDMHAVFFCPVFFKDDIITHELKREIPPDKLMEISSNVFEKLAYRDASDGIIALAEPKMLSFSSLKINDAPLLIVLEAVEKPGNLGAVLRTADAAGVGGVIVCDPLADIYNPNTIRSSLGCVFNVPVIACTSVEAIHWLKEKNIRIMAAALTAHKFYHESKMTGPLAIVMGTEATGLTAQWLDHADECVLIPMSGKIDSLNVSVSTAILVFEAMRQRGFGKRQ